MKLLAIRGAGLASLSEPFVVELWRGPLAQAGVFAIVGPTGAGKSTLLDAVFLALFGQPPRLGALERVRVGGDGHAPRDPDALTSRDARSLARSDAQLAYAEVDFAGVDGGIYRARWETRRKRARAADGDGASEGWRRAEHALSRLGSPGDVDGQRIGGTKTEVLAHIQARLGLDLAQFRRSVVLAQGEIAAFLHAADRDRAELLERMTGTELYAAISRKLHEEASRRGVRVAVQREQWAAITVLDTAQRAEAERLAQAARTEVEVAREHARTAEASVAKWRGLLDVLAERDAAQLDHERHLEALAAAAPRREALAQERALAQLAPLWSALALAEAELAERTARLTTLDEARLRATARAEAHGAAASLASEAHRRAEITRDEAAHAEEAALGELGVARASAEQAASQLRAHAALEVEAAEAAGTLERASAAEGAARAALATWSRLAATHPGLEPALARFGSGALEDASSADALAGQALALRSAVAEAHAAIERGRSAAAAAEAARERAERQSASSAEIAAAVATRRARAEAKVALTITDAERVLHETPHALHGAHDGLAGGGLAGDGLAGTGLAGDGLPLAGTAVPDETVTSATRPGRGGASAFLRAVRPATQRMLAASVGDIATHADGDLVRVTEAAAPEPLAMAAPLARRRDVHLPSDAPRRSAARPDGPATSPAPLASRGERLQRASWAERSRIDQALLTAEQRFAEVARQRRERSDDRVLLARFATDLARLSDAVIEAEGEARAAEGALAAVIEEGHAAALRARLAPGSPCDVCGSTEHPRGAEPSHPPTERASLHDAAAAHRRALDEARAAHADLAARHAALTATFPMLARLAAAAPVPHDDPRPALLERRRSLDEAIAALDAALRELGESNEAAARAEAQRAEAARRASEASAEARHAAEQLARAEESLARARRERAELGLDGLVDHVSSRSAGDAEARAALRGLLRDGRVALREARRAEARMDLLEAARIEAERHAAHLAAALTASELTIEAARRAVARFDVLSASATAAHERRAQAEQALSRARTLEDDEREAAARASREAEEHARALDGTREGERSARARGLALREELARSLAAAGVSGSLDEARARAGAPMAQLDAELEALEALEAAVERARTVLDERGRRALAQLRGAAGGLDAAPADEAGWRALAQQAARQLEAARAGVDRARAAEAAVSTELAHQLEVLRADDVAQGQRARLEQTLADEERELAIWDDLSDVLGSADGKKLRVLAQRRALRVLVREASIHLSTLAPRYAVEVVPGTDLSIQVRDRALGGEARPIGALSGGETFLVSLALALGLRALASTRVRIGTLFIDEGFGTLDPGSLDVVLSALDALEATGRQIGIVSHVPEIRERFAARIEVQRSARGTSVVRVAV